MDAPGPIFAGGGAMKNPHRGKRMAQQHSTSTPHLRKRGRSAICDIRNILIVVLFLAWLFDQLLDGLQHKTTTVDHLQDFAVPYRFRGCKKNKEETPRYDRDSGDKVISEDRGDGSRESNNGSQLTPIAPHEPLPDWRLVTECSAFAVDCPAMIVHKRGGFRPYPFYLLEPAKHEWKTWSKLPKGWKKELEELAPNYDEPYDRDSFYVYPPQRTSEEVEACVKRRTTTPYHDQLKEVLDGLDRNKELDMVLFTISDISYAKDEIHDYFEMSADKVEFHNAAFMVALDVATLELGCRFGYPVIASDAVLSAEGELRSKVQTTKFVVSRDILKAGVSFLFYEMDVYWLKSPLPELLEHQEDIVVSSHFDNAWSPNIGIYVARATPGGLEFFEIALDLLRQSPATHDQAVFTSVRDKVRRDLHKESGPDWEYITKLYKEPIPEEPTVKNQITTYALDTLLVSAQIRLQVNEHTLAVHPLCNFPLTSPHGKKMMAKEVGAWYGFQGPMDGGGGYYKRRGDKRRYLFLDGRAWGGLSSTKNLGESYGFYHQPGSFKWTMATLVVLARRTNRILVLPKVVGDEANGYVWWLMDLKTVEDQVEIRETNFPSNPKSWASDDMPFNSVARTALDYVNTREVSGQWRMAAQVNDRDGSLRAWTIDSKDPVQAWFGLNILDPEIKDVEALFVNPQYINAATQWTSVCMPEHKDQMIPREIRHMMSRRLKWCDASYISRTPAKTTAEQDCYGRGELLENLNCDYGD